MRTGFVVGASSGRALGGRGGNRGPFGTIGGPLARHLYRDDRDADLDGLALLG